VSRILQAGRNCWRIERAGRVAFLIDGKAYFAALREAARAAERSMLIAGWDIDARVRMLRDGEDDGLPNALGDFLNEVVSQRDELHAHVLLWDFAMIYALERAFLPLYKMQWRTHRRLDFRMNDRCPTGASQHEKIVVVDDAVGFCGGFDLGKWRWDTPEHRADDPRRVDPTGSSYPPFHDIQVMVDGDAAAALGDLVRRRWEQATGETLEPVGEVETDRWPESVVPDLEAVDVALARTEPAHAGASECREVERLHLDAIDAAERWIYLENQYLTSSAIGDALARRLAERDGPEVVLVLPEKTGGWLEQATMDVLRSRLLGRLREADAGGRLRVYYPTVPGLRPDWCISVHAKVLVIDDDLVRIGSSNTSNRSMGLDTECDLAVEAAGDARVAQGIRALRNRLLGEHLGRDPEDVESTLAAEHSLVGTIERLRGGARTLEDLDGRVPESRDREVPPAAVIDPERPLDPEDLADRLLPDETRTPLRRQVIGSVAILVALVALAALWRFSPLSEWLDPESVARTVEDLRAHPAGPLIAVAGFVVGGLAVFPVSVLIVASALVFGAVTGFVCSLVGGVLSAAVAYGLGHGLGRGLVRRIAGQRINRLSRRLARRGIATVAVVRLVPVAPFTVVNMVAGASHIRFVDFIVGTFIGMLPGIAALTLFAGTLEHTIREPSAGTVALLVGVVVLLALFGAAVNRWVGGARRRTDAGTSG